MEKESGLVEGHLTATYRPPSQPNWTDWNGPDDPEDPHNVGIPVHLNPDLLYL